MEPWGISGPLFVVLYDVIFAGSVILMLLVQKVLTRAGSGRGADTAELDVYEAAHLAGGVRRLVDTAIAALAIRGLVHVSRDGRLTVTGDAGGAGPIETAVATELRRNPLRSVVYAMVRNAPAVRAVDRRLRSRGLLLGGSRALLWRLVAVPPVVVFAIGILRLVNGLALGRPIESLVLSLLLSLGVLIWVFFTMRSQDRQVTPLGRAVLDRLRLRHRQQTGGRRDVPADWQLTGVALVGYAAVADPILRAALAGAPLTKGSRSYDDSCGSSSTTSCGG
ncbi:TIGR04222 domain-containing membrane protein [Actinophytocola sp.]|uniref:TIGR04222 domain-containing membrane protein n=1 Tax=Actinophytocola sp. TaxID=1872138 RepID=UPI002D80A4F5|nr:TIGR04222 domain-containing membrane protein [Actinophytocola sp.]HET9141879.1 TIGR04222 domain-containing membrane protein [Actinophytocola sp.]